MNNCKIANFKMIFLQIVFQTQVLINLINLNYKVKLIHNLFHQQTKKKLIQII